jgi:hypothetical protein
MAHISRILCLAAPLCATAWCTTYYVDRVAGSDGNAGTLPAAAWESLDRVGQAAFSPGDYILLKRGQVWNEALVISSSGLPEAPITYGAFGAGAAPAIDGTGVAIAVHDGLVSSDGQSNVIIRDLEIRNSPVDGIVPYLANGLEILNCAVHDNQFNGIFAFNGNNITIDGSDFYNNSLSLAASYAGIAIDGDLPPQSNVIISNNTIHDNIGGEGWLGANGIYFGHTGTHIPTLQNVLVTGNDIFRNGNPDQNQAGRGISGSFNGSVTVVKNRIYENASAGVYVGDVNLTLTIVIAQNVFWDNALRQLGGITNGSGLAEQNLLYVDDPTITAMGAEVGGNGPWTIQRNVFTFVTNTTDQWRGFIRINDPVQDGLLQSNFNVFYSAGPNRWKRSDGTILSFSQWQSFGFDANSTNPQ